MDERNAPEPTTETEPRRSRQRPRWSGLVGTALALTVAFVWGGLAYRELGPKTAAYSVASVSSGVRGAATAVRGSEAPPAWVGDFAKAFCGGDAQHLADRLGPPLTGQVQQIEQALSQRDWTCTEMRYIGGGANPKGSFYVYVMTDKQSEEQWWVFTVVDDKVIAID